MEGSLTFRNIYDGPPTNQHNEIGERKNGHLLDQTRANIIPK